MVKCHVDVFFSVWPFFGRLKFGLSWWKSYRISMSIWSMYVKMGDKKRFKYTDMIWRFKSGFKNSWARLAWVWLCVCECVCACMNHGQSNDKSTSIETTKSKKKVEKGTKLKFELYFISMTLSDFWSRCACARLYSTKKRNRRMKRKMAH